MNTIICPACGQPGSETDASCSGCGASMLSETWVEMIQPQSSSTDSLVGRTISHFRVLEEVGNGGMGVVYRARDLKLNREVALKLMAPRILGKPQDEARFLREARAAAALDHPNIGTIYEIGEHEGRHFLAMALYDGETLAARLERAGALSIPEAVAITAQLASALVAAHEAGVVHRDLKPSNIQITGAERVKLLDFGLARRFDDPTLTEANVAVGTAAYMAPERLRGEQGGPAADLWALGVALYEMLTGNRPFGGERQGMLHSILYEEPPPLRGLRPDTPSVVERIVARCLAKEPGQRHGSAEEILDELHSAGLSWGLGNAAIITPPRHKTWRIRAWTIAAILPLALGITVLPRMGKPEPPLYIAILKPEISGSLHSDKEAQVVDNIKVALFRTATALEGITALEGFYVDAVEGPPLAVARAMAAGEIVVPEADCTDDMCQVTLRRLSGADGHVLWSETLRLPASSPLLFANAVAASLRQGYEDRDLLVSNLEFQIEEQDYQTYLDLRHQKPSPELIAQVTQLRRRTPSFLNAYILEAWFAQNLHLKTGDVRFLGQAIETAEQASRLAMDDPRPLRILYSLYMHAGDLDEAEATLQRLEEIDPAYSLCFLGWVYEKRGRSDQALALRMEAARLQPSWSMLLYLADIEGRLGRLDDARRHYEILLERSPGNIIGLMAWADMEFLRNPDRAATLLREAARRAPDANTLADLGTNLLLLRRYAEAERNLRQALALQPDSPSVKLNLADCLLLLGHKKEARRLYRQVVEQAEQLATTPQWQILSRKAQALAHLGETAQAVESIRQAVLMEPNDAQLAYQAAIVYAVAEDRRSALFHAQQAARRGVDTTLFALPFFDLLRTDSSFQALLTQQRTGGSDLVRLRSLNLF